MNSFVLPTLSILALVVVAGVLVFGRAAFPQYRRSPTSTSPHDLIGSLKSQPYKAFARWSRTLGPIITINILWKRIVIVNSFKAGHAIFNQPSDRLSNKPVRVAAHLCRYDMALALMSSRNKYFKRTWKRMHEGLSPRVIADQTIVFERSARQLLTALVDTHPGSNIHDCIRVFFTRTILMWTLGYDAVAGDDDPFLRLSEKVSHNAINILAPSSKFWIELFPIYKYLPIWLAGPRAARTLYQYLEEIGRLKSWSESYLRKSTDKPEVESSFLSRLYATSESQEDIEIALYASMSLTGGAYDTMISLTTTLLFVMIRFPEVQRKAHEEIDALLERRRLPTTTDRPSLPYFEALLTELMRWMPPIPMTSRLVAQDEIYEGYSLPGNSTVVGNIWAMMRDPERFADPEEFRPERYLETPDRADNDVAKMDARDVKRLVFGFGRRTCPGKYFADAALWITACSLLAVFEVSSPDSSSPLKEPEIEDGAIIKFASFPCKLKLRYAEAIDLIRDAANSG